MENTPSSNKRNRGEVFTSPESDSNVNYKRSCSNLETGVLSPSSDSDLCIEQATFGPNMASDSDPLVNRMIEMFQHPAVMSAIVSAVTASIRPVFREEMNSLVENNKRLESEVKQLNEKLEQKDQVILELSERQDRAEQYSRRNNIRISGIRETEGENTDKLVIDLAKSIGVDINNSDIDISHRVPRRPTTPQTTARPIIVKFVSNAKQRDMLSARKKLRDIQSQNKERIFVNEDLTRIRASLAGKARALVKDKRVESAWVTGGVILIKLKDGHVTKVANERQFNQVCESTRLKLVINLSQDG